jgi:hypothetical protein
VTTEKPAAEKPARKAKIGDVLKTGDRYKLVVGFEDVEHIDADAKGATRTESHPIVVDLGPGASLQTEHTIAE